MTGWKIQSSIYRGVVSSHNVLPKKAQTGIDDLRQREYTVLPDRLTKESVMDSDGIKTSLRQFIKDNFIKGQTDKTVGDDDSFFEKEIIDSTGVLELVLFLEQTFGFPVEDEEIIPENLDSMNRLVGYVRSKLAESGAVT